MTLLNSREAALVVRLLRGLSRLDYNPLNELTPDEVMELVQRLEQGEQRPIGPKVMRNG